MRLYGVHHGGSKRDLFGFNAGYIFVKPSPELKKELLEFPKGARIGLETLPPAYNHSIDVDGEEIPFDESSTYYWDEILSFCQINQFDVCFLDDPETMRAAIRKRKEAISAQRHVPILLDLIELARKPSKRLHVRKLHKLEKEIYTLQTEADYLHAIERETRIIENIRRFSPLAVLVGAAHGDYFMSQRGDGLNFDSYSVDEIPQDFRSTVRGNEFLESEFVKDTKPRPNILAEREAIIRRYTALTKRRILPERTPQFIGTWNLDLPAGGLFEVYVDTSNDGTLSGSIEDINGRARFSGRVTKSYVQFEKTYEEVAICAGGAAGPITYNGRFRNGKYYGEFRTELTQGNFWMRPFN